VGCICRHSLRCFVVDQKHVFQSWSLVLFVAVDCNVGLGIWNFGREFGERVKRKLT